MTAHSHPRTSRTTIRERHAAWATALRERSIDPLGLHLTFPDHKGARAATPAIDRMALLEVLDAIRADITAVLEDAESKHPEGWGPDVTTVWRLRQVVTRIDELP